MTDPDQPSPQKPTPSPAPATQPNAGGPERGNPPTPPDQSNSIRLSVGRDLLGLAFLLVIGAFVVAVAFYPAASDVTTVIGPITTLVGTLIGTIFGAQVASQGRNQQSAQQAETTKIAVASALVHPGTPEAHTLAASILSSSTQDSGLGDPDFS